MNKRLLFILGFLMALILTGCQQNIKGNGSKQIETRDLPPIETIRLVGNFQANINIGPTQQVSLTSDSNIIPYIQTEVDDKNLTIKTKRGYILQPTQPPQFDITVNRLTNLTIIGSGSVNASSISADDFEIKIMGSGNANLAGSAKEVEIKIIGSGQIVANNLVAEKAKVQLLGAGNIAVYANKKLNIHVSGDGNVKYYGEPREVEQKISGNGEVIGIPNAEKSSTQNPG